jgi:hypothetical protein
VLLYIPPIPSSAGSTFQLATMDSESVKAEVVKQVRTQYALSNTRELIEVRMSAALPWPGQFSLVLSC